jgi:DNA helicase HerA-like ATPase
VLKQHDLHVLVDEAHNYSSAHRIGTPYARLVRDAGNQNISYTAIFQRPAENHKSIISNATHIFVFKLPLHTDADYLRKWVGTEVELLLQPEFRRFYKDEPILPQRSFIYKDIRADRPVVVRGGI